jgi:hypothetical protein
VNGSIQSGGKYILDTNMVIHVLAEKIDLRRHLRSAAESFLWIGTLGESYSGAEGPPTLRPTFAGLRASPQACAFFCVTPRPQATTSRSSNSFGRGVAPFPDNDPWIAATAQRPQGVRSLRLSTSRREGLAISTRCASNSR